MPTRPLYPVSLQTEQPTGLYGVQEPSRSDSLKPACSKASGSMLVGALQLAHKRRASRCAVIRMTDEAMLNAGTPILARRVSVVGASLVCKVLNTMCPVCAALIEMSAVSRSRISPTMITSGSWRKKAFKAEAKVSPALSLTFTWLIPCSWISAGSSAVEILIPGWFKIFRQV